MARLQQFRLPDLGEGLTEGEILKWLVAPGDDVKLNQPLVEVETAKAAVEVPSPFAGVVAELHHGEGETVDVGTPIVTFDTEPGSGAPAGPAADDLSGGVAERAAAAQAAGAAANPAEALPGRGGVVTESRLALGVDVLPAAAAAEIEMATEDAPVEPGLIGGPAPGGRTSVLVGYGPRSVTAKRRPRKQTADPAARSVAPQQALIASPEPARVAALPPAPAAPPPPAPAAPPPPAASSAARNAGAPPVLAKPPVRKLARDLGVDLRSLRGTGPGGVITREDVDSAAATARNGAAAEPSFDPAAREHRIPIKGVRKHTAAAMVASAFTAPHVTEFITVDVTPMMELRDRVAALPEFAGLRVTPLLFVVKALLLAVRRSPMINSSWDDAAQEIVVKDYVNLGIAAATPRGLIVPNIKDAGRLSLVELAGALQALTATAREGRTTPADMAGGTITITNVGSFGVDNGTPILNPGESAILCLGAIRPTPWVYDGGITVRQVTALSLSFDHRIVDGQLGSQFLADVARVLADPAVALLWS